jgi:2-(1,2-epoxy-1,2-dihydrophenyl)acetyl-CoA isomerase
MRGAGATVETLTAPARSARGTTTDWISIVSTEAGSQRAGAQVQAGLLGYGGDQVTLDLGADRAGGVAVAALNRPPHNYLTESGVQALGQAFEDAVRAGTRCLVLAATGRNFCAGASLQAKLGGGVDFGMYEHIPALFSQPIPIVAAVQGRAIGAGLGLALAADYRVVTAQTRFAAPFTKLGFHHGFGLSVTLPRVVGPQRASDMLVVGTEVGGGQAYSIGLADRLAPEEELLACALGLAGEIATAAPLGVRAVRQGLRGDLAGQVRQALATEQEIQETLMRTADFVEGVAAASERRAPRFRGE